VWARDFQFDATADGRRLKFLNVIDEHSRLCLAIRVGRRCKAKDVVAVVEELTSLYPAPSFIRSDNGPEFIAQALRDWCEASITTSTCPTTIWVSAPSTWLTRNRHGLHRTRIAVRERIRGIVQWPVLR